MSNHSGSPLSLAVVEAIADVRGVSPMDVDPLYEFIDPDAIARLAAHDGSQWRLEFVVAGHEVFVESGGTIVVDGQSYRYEE